MSAAAPLDAVVFDAGGTLVRLDFEWIASMLASFGVHTTPAALRSAEIDGRRAYDAAAVAHDRAGTSADPGATQAAIDAYWNGLLGAAGCPADRSGEAVRLLHARQASEHFLWARPVEGARAVIDALGAMGLRLACVSNSDGRAGEHLERAGLRAGLECVIDSARVGIEKPDPRIFALALERLGATPARALYVGDLWSVDVRGARAAGLHVVLLDPDGTYAPPHTLAIATLGDLPALLEHRFVVPSAPSRRRL